MRILLLFLLSIAAFGAAKGLETVTLLNGIKAALIEEGYGSREAIEITRDLLHTKSIEGLIDAGVDEDVAIKLADQILLAENADKCATDPSESKKGTPNHTQSRKTGNVTCTAPTRKNTSQYNANKAAAKATRAKQAKADKKKK